MLYRRVAAIPPALTFILAPRCGQLLLARDDGTPPAVPGQERSPAEQPGAARFRLRIQPVDVNAQIGDNRPSCTVTKRARGD